MALAPELPENWLRRALRIRERSIAMVEDQTIRLARPDEWPAVLSCVETAYAKYVPRMGMKPAPMLADYAALIARDEVYVIPGPDGVHGVLVIEPRADHLFIENIAVRPADQGRGYGYRLLRFAEDQARALGLPELRLYTHEVMTENLPYYARFGFEETGRRTEDGYQRVFMRKRLPDQP